MIAVLCQECEKIVYKTYIKLLLQADAILKSLVLSGVNVSKKRSPTDPLDELLPKPKQSNLKKGDRSQYIRKFY
ncbi:MAG: hypothetical protein N2235_21180 [Fischerella sp.]|nr:hypothetical protein [Fischerella sp.]